MKRPEGAWFRWEGDDLLLFLRVQPRAGRDEFVSPLGDRYKVRITAPPVDGKANDHLLRFLARSFGVRQERVLLTAGINSRDKGVRIRAPRRFPIPVKRI